MNLSRIFFATAFIILPARPFSQEFLPIVSQYNRNDYSASNQNWAVEQASDRKMYFGNNRGLLQFDGSTWEIFRMPGNKLVRSIYISPGQSKKIYVGSFEEFGYFEKSGNGQPVYFSISSKLRKYRMQNDEIWKIFEWNGKIIFQSFTSFFTYKDGIVKGFRCPYTFLFFSPCKGKVFTYTNQKGLCYINPDNGVVTPVTGRTIQNPVISVLPYDNRNCLLVTKSDGLYLFDGKIFTRFGTQVDNLIRKAEINKAVMAPDGTIILGTILEGVTAVDHKGRYLWKLNTDNVLQNNTILGMSCDMDNNLWLALDKGISMVRLNSSLKSIQAFHPSIGTIYTVRKFGTNIYIGTNQGLYTANIDPNGFRISGLRLIPEIKGQVWDLSIFDNQMFCGNNEETFEISGNGVHKVTPVKGGMCIRTGIINGKEVLVQGTYTQLCIFLRDHGRWKFAFSVNGFINPVRYLEIDYTGTIWACHLHQGLYAIKLSNDLRSIVNIKRYLTLNGINKLPISVFKLDNRVVFTDKTGIYTYDDIRKHVIPYNEIDRRLGYFSNAYRICQFRNDLYWFINEEEAALIQFEGNRFRLIDWVPFALLNNQTVDDYQNVVPFDMNKCFFTLENGLAIFNTGKSGVRRDIPKISFKSVVAVDAEAKRKVFMGLESDETQRTPYRRNNLSFTVSFPYYDQMSDIRFRYRLDGLDKVWSEPSKTPQKIYNYLPWGKYTFHAQAITRSGIILSENSYSFVVSPPFYWSVLARIIYLLIAIYLINAVYRHMLKIFQFKKEKIRKEEKEKRQLEIDKKEQQIIALKNEKLENELTLKSKKLAESTMTIIKKNELLANIKEELTAQKKALGSQYPNKYYEKIVRILDENLSSEDDWVIFQNNFDRIHENFFRNLHIKYPELTSNDLRFCAYLRLNLTSKDIAHLMNISIKGVEMGRYRIRKKIGIPSEKSLTEFMIEFK